MRAWGIPALFLATLPAIVVSEEPPGTGQAPSQPPRAAPEPLLGAAGSEESRRQVLSLLQENRRTYGDDAAILQGLLLVHAIQADAVLASEASIVGFEDFGGRRYVSFRVVSGAVFNDNEMGRDQRLERIWHTVVERTLSRYPSFQVKGDGIVVEVVYNHRPYASAAELYRTIDDPGAVERVKVYILTSDLLPFLEHRVEAQQLLDRSLVLLDGSGITPKLSEPALMGPPAPDPRP